jgi:hypothetical protein
MTIDEIFRRVVRGHKWVIALCVLVPVMAIVVLTGGKPVQWESTVPIQVVSAAPTSSTQAEGISSRVLALATTPSMLSKAIHDAKVKADPVAVAKRVTAERLGESPIVRLGVTGTNKARTKKIVMALAARIADFMNQGDRSRFQAVVADVDSRIAAAQKSQQSLADNLDHTSSLMGRQGIRLRLLAVEQNLAALASERTGLVLSDAARDQVTVIDVNDPQVQQLPSGVLPRAALAGLLGLALGLTFAAGLEMLRPRVGGTRAMARALQSPVIGHLRQPPPALAAAMTLAARRRGVETVVLVAADDRDKQTIPRLLTSIRKPSALLVPNNGSSESATFTPFGTVRFTTIDDLKPEDEFSAGVVVIAAKNLSWRRMEDLNDVLNVVRWPVVGVLDSASGIGRGPR